VYAHVESDTPWPQRTRKEVSLFSVRAGERTTVQILGQADDLVDSEGPAIEWRQEGDHLQIRAARMQRLYNNRGWPNPVVLKITDASVGLIPPTVQTGEAHPDADSPSYQLHGRLVDLGEGEAVEAGFEFRLRRLLTDAADEWRQTNRQNLQSTGDFSARIVDLAPGSAYEFRAVVHHRAVTVYGDNVTFSTP
jgi:alpha-L-fucosidase